MTLSFQAAHQHLTHSSCRNIVDIPLRSSDAAVVLSSTSMLSLVRASCRSISSASFWPDSSGQFFVLWISFPSYDPGFYMRAGTSKHLENAINKANSIVAAVAVR